MSDELKNLEQQFVQNSHWPFFGCFMQQTPNAVLSLNRLLNAHNFDCIIELGTHDGGLSSLFALYCLGSQMPASAESPSEPSLYKNQTHHKRPKKFYTFDNELRDIPRLNLLIQMGSVFKQVDFLNDANIIAEIRQIIATSGSVLLLCDGGNKKKEIELYSPALKRGDFVMTHDFMKDETSAQKIREAGIWQPWETRWENGIGPNQQFGIKEACVANGIERVYAEEFDSSVWFCGVKR
jgi:cephalosporin hydroxylase